jgi:hypothetical protein
MDEVNEIGSIYSDCIDTDGPKVLKMLDKQSDGEGTLFEMLTPSQQGIFGDRCPDGFKKLVIFMTNIFCSYTGIVQMIFRSTTCLLFI